MQLSSTASECAGEAVPVLLIILGVGEALELHMVSNVAVLASQGRAVLLALPAAGQGQALQLVVVHGRLLDAVVHNISVSVPVLDDWSCLLVVQIDATVSGGDGVPRAGPGVPWYCFRRRCFRSIIFGFDQ